MDYTLLFILAFLGSTVGLSGGLLLLSSEKVVRIVCRYAVPFAAGVLLTVSFMDLLPEAVHILNEEAFMYVLGAFVIGLLIELWFDHFHHHDHEGNDKDMYERRSSKTVVPLIALGDTIHNFIDGISITAAYLINPGLGVTVALSTLLHEIPHEVGDFGIMLHAGYSKVKVLVINVLSSLSTFVGVLFVLVFMRESTEFLGILLAFSAGMFIYISGANLIPRITQSKPYRIKKIAVFLFGVICMIVVGMIVPHGHSEEETSTSIQEDIHEDDTE